MLTDVHLPEQCAPTAEAVDVLQIPAYPVPSDRPAVAAADTGAAINVKKGQFLAPWDMKNVAGKISGSGNANAFYCASEAPASATTRWSRTCGHCRSWPRPATRSCSTRRISVQQPAAKAKKSGGERRFVETLARAAVAVGVAACSCSWKLTKTPTAPLSSDGPNMVPLKALPELL